MELYEAKFDYEKERDDVLSFRKGDQFEITHKPDSKWWAAKRVSDNAMGYVPALYLQHTKDRVVGRLIPEDIRKSSSVLKPPTSPPCYSPKLPRQLTKIPPMTLPKQITSSREMKPPNSPSFHRTRQSPCSSPNLSCSPKFSLNSPKLSSSPRIAGSPRIPTAFPMSIRTSSSSSFNQSISSSMDVSPQQSPLSPPVSTITSQTKDSSTEQEHNIHLQALLELQRKVKPIPAHVVKAALGATNQLTNQKGDALSNEDDNDEENAKDGVPYHHKCNVNTSDYQYTDKMDDINITPYHHQCIAADAVIDDGSDDSDLPFHLKFPPPDEAPPTPDYDLEDYQFDDMTPFHHKYHINAEDSFPFPPDEEDVEIRPKPLPNPVLQSKKHQELHRELKLISKTNPKGFDKPELTKAFAARKSAEEEKQTTIVEDNQPEFMKLKLRHRSDSQGSNNS
ncbi:uncharacterized protein LOC100368964 [Saccoglossus kowalevskii]